MSAHHLLKHVELLRSFSDYALTFDDYIFFDFSLLNTESFNFPFLWRLVQKKSLLEIGLDNPSGIFLYFRVVLFSGKPERFGLPAGPAQESEVGIPRFSTEFWDSRGDPHSTKGHLFDISQNFIVQLGAQSLRIVLDPDPIRHWIDLPGRGTVELNAERHLCAFHFEDVTGEEMAAIERYLSRNRQ